MNISTFKNNLTRELHGTTLNKVTDIDGLINSGARDLLLDVDANETIRIIPLASQVFNSVYDYPAPTDLKGTRIIDIRPQVNRLADSVFGAVYNQSFDITKGNWWRDILTVNFNTAVKSLRLSAPTLLPPTVLNSVSSLTDQGTWAAGSSASNLAVDTVNFVTNNASLSFDLASSGSTGYLENSTMPDIDISSFKNQGTIFLYTFLPTAASFTNVKLRWGSSSSNYYEVTATTTQQGTTFQDGWNLLKFTWLGATQVGTPDNTDFEYLRITWTYNGTAQTAVRLSQVTIGLGSILEIEYYSKYLFRDASTGAFQETVTDDTNLINLDTESYNLLLYKVSELMAQQTQGLDAMFYDGNFYTQRYQNALAKYQGMYKSQVQKPQSTYYRKPQPQVLVPNRIQRY